MSREYKYQIDFQHDGCISHVVMDFVEQVNIGDHITNPNTGDTYSVMGKLFGTSPISLNAVLLPSF